MIGRILLGLLFGIACASASAQESTESAESIVHHVVERDGELTRHRAIYTYTVEETRQKLDEKGRVTSTERTTQRIRGDRSPDYGTRPSQGRGIEADLRAAAKEEPFNILHILSHYRYQRRPDETIDGVPCYRIDFAPKGGDQPYRNREEKVANGLAGTFWVAKADYSLIRNTGHLTQPVAVAWFFATVRDLHFLFETKPLPNGEPGPSKIEYEFRVQVPMMQVHERHIRWMKNYTAAP